MRNNIQPDNEDAAKQMARKIFSTLKQFTDYCINFLHENKENYEENYQNWITVISDWKGTEDELIKSYLTIIDMYTYWLEFSITSESYESAAIIRDAIAYERQNYERLSQDLFNKKLNVK